MHGPGIDAHWRKIPARHSGVDVTSEYATMPLLPWPLQVHASDFRPVADSVQQLGEEPFGFFEFAPAEKLDFDLLDRVLVAARQEVNSIDVVLLPESTVDENDIDALEGLLHFHGAISLVAGTRQESQPGRLPGNWIHLSFNPRLEKGTGISREAGPSWFHVRQNKHHRWSFDRSQILQYHLGGVLHPDVRWWEARGAAPGGRIHRSRRAHDGVAGLRGPGAERRRGCCHAISRSHDGDGCTARRTAAELSLGGTVRKRAGR